MRVEPVDRFGDCPPKFEQLFVGLYPGTVKGCNCLHISWTRYEGVRTRKLNRNECSRNETKAGCHDVRATHKTTLKRYLGHSMFCGQRVPELNFYDLRKHMKRNGDCMKGYRKCGDINGISKGLCIPITYQDCPITKIQLAASNPDPETYTEVQAVQSRYRGAHPALQPPLNLYYTRKSISQPLVDFNLTEDHMCISAESLAVTETRSVYQLYNKTKRKCREDKRFIEHDSMGEKDIFDLNGVMYRQLPAFKVSNTYRYKRFTRAIIPLKPQCIPQIENFMMLRRKIDDYLRRMKLIRGVNIATMILSGVFGICSIVANIALKRSRKVFICLMFPRHILLFFMIFLLVLTSYSAGTHFGFYKTGKWAKCSDEFTNTEARLLGRRIAVYLVKENFGIAIFLAINLVVQICFETFKWRVFDMNFRRMWSGGDDEYKVRFYELEALV